MRPAVGTRRCLSMPAAPEVPQHRREHTRKMSAVSYSLQRANGSAEKWCCQFATGLFLPRMRFLTGLARPAITTGFRGLSTEARSAKVERRRSHAFDISGENVRAVRRGGAADDSGSPDNVGSFI